MNPAPGAGRSITPRNKAQRIAFIHSFDRRLPSWEDPRAAGTREGAYRYCLPLDDGRGLIELVGLPVDDDRTKRLRDRAEDLSGFPETDAVITDALEEFNDRHVADTERMSPGDCVASSAVLDRSAIILDPADWHPAQTIPEYLGEMSAADARRAADLLADFKHTSSKAALAYLRFAADHAQSTDENQNPVILDDRDPALHALLDEHAAV